jgi:hypothetical protein
MRRVLFIAVVASLIYCSLGIAHAQMMPTAYVDGYVMRSGQNMPGLTVSLVHPMVGRSSPSYTDAYGHYYFSNVPLQPDAYYLEVYWGTQLLFRNTILVTMQRVNLPPIVLQ